MHFLNYYYYYSGHNVTFANQNAPRHIDFFTSSALSKKNLSLLFSRTVQDSSAWLGSL